jgi:molecular chaperone IbpA|tara:strand:+ start:84 stop:428 length:345 start_codon:yes stop_codon:yes gene_type:complete
MAKFNNTEYPRYNIKTVNGTDYILELALPGWKKEWVHIDYSNIENTLLIRGERPKTANEESYVHKGISGKSFTRDFRLAEHLEVTSAKLDEGLLVLELTLNMPDELQPQVIEIT